MDLSLFYETGFTYLYGIFHDIVSSLINEDRLANINGEDYLNDEACMVKLANDFAIGSKGVLKGVIGAIDSWLVKIHRPT